MRFRFQFFLLLFFISLQAYSQLDTNLIKMLRPYDHEFISLETGFNYSLYSFGEIGIAKNFGSVNGGNFQGHTTYFSTEIKFDKSFVAGPKIGGWFCVDGLCFGGALIYYTNFNSSSLSLRPEFGLGMDKYKFTVGNNFALTKKDFYGINKPNLSLVILFGLKQIRGF